MSLAVRLLGLLLAGSLLLGACSSEPELDLLRDHPLSNVTLSFAEPSDRAEVDLTVASGISLGGAPSHAVIRISFESLPPELVDQGRQELFDQVEALGLTVERWAEGASERPNLFFAEQTGELVIWIEFGEDWIDFELRN